jgi:mono/diheme cytochrome c family protein
MLRRAFIAGLGGAVAWPLVALVASNLGGHAETTLERGAYLVNAVMACDGCHTPRGPDGMVMDKRFSGGAQTFTTAAYTVKGSNITQDRDTGIGTWSEADLKRALIDGVRPDGIPLAPIMPFAFYRIMTPADLGAVVTYVRSVPAVRNTVQVPDYKAATAAVPVPGGQSPVSEEAMKNDPLQRGFYLATIAHCMECHSRRADGVLDFNDNFGKGGDVMRGPFGSVVVANITAHPTKGIGAWTDDEIKRALTTGIGRDGHAFALPMARQGYFSKMTPGDLDALVMWVRTIPAMD